MKLQKSSSVVYLCKDDFSRAFLCEYNDGLIIGWQAGYIADLLFYIEEEKGFMWINNVYTKIE